MPINKSALIRYKTIDNCLQNRFRKWTLEDLMAACSDALYAYEGITKGISKRSIQMDLQNMRSEKLGYNAPIIVTDKKYYSYSQKGYSITNSPLTQQDVGTLNQVLGVLKQFKGFGHFQEVSQMVTRLEDKLYKQQHKGQSYIDFEKNELIKGVNHIDPLHISIMNKKVIAVIYQSFKAKTPQVFTLYPYLLKEYRNRWFLLCAVKKSMAVMTLALDRIISYKDIDEEPFKPAPVNVKTYFNDVIGVTKSTQHKAQTIVLKITPDNAPYILTKPLHNSQKILKEEKDGTIFSIEVIWNFELEREILGFGEHIKVLSPVRLSRKIKRRMQEGMLQYEFHDEGKINE